MLLKGARNTYRGYLCKLADFGLSRWGWRVWGVDSEAVEVTALLTRLSVPACSALAGTLFHMQFSAAPPRRMLERTVSHVDTGTYGTPNHAAPELLREGRLSPAADVFAFGILGGRALSGWSVAVFLLETRSAGDPCDHAMDSR